MPSSSSHPSIKKPRTINPSVTTVTLQNLPMIISVWIDSLLEYYQFEHNTSTTFLVSCKKGVQVKNKILCKVITTVPEEKANEIREAMVKAGAGHIGNYSHCTFSVKGIGRFKPEEGANPAIGEVGKLEEVVEERIETVCKQ